MRISEEFVLDGKDFFLESNLNRSILPMVLRLLLPADWASASQVSRLWYHRSHGSEVVKAVGQKMQGQLQKWLVRKLTSSALLVPIKSGDKEPFIIFLARDEIPAVLKLALLGQLIRSFDRNVSDKHGNLYKLLNQLIGALKFSLLQEQAQLENPVSRTLNAILLEEDFQKRMHLAYSLPKELAFAKQCFGSLSWHIEGIFTPLLFGPTALQRVTSAGERLRACVGAEIKILFPLLLAFFGLGSFLPQGVAAPIIGIGFIIVPTIWFGVVATRYFYQTPSQGNLIEERAAIERVLKASKGLDSEVLHRNRL